MVPGTLSPAFWTWRRLLLSPVHTSNSVEASNIVECYKSNDSFDKVERCFDIVAGVDEVLGGVACIARLCR